MPSKHVVRTAGSPPHGANKEIVVDLLVQTLQAERGRDAVLEAATKAAQGDLLRAHLRRSRARCAFRVQALQAALDALGIPAEHETPGRDVVRRVQESLLAAMDDGLAGAPLDVAQLIAADCVVAVEAKTDACWRLVRVLAKALAGERGAILRTACASVGPEEDDQPASAAWAHGLWLRTIGLAAAWPPEPLPTPRADRPAPPKVPARRAR